MNPPVNIKGKFPQLISPGIFDIFDSLRGVSDFSNRSTPPWYCATISENPGCDRIFQNSGRKKFFEDEKYQRKKYKTQLQSNNYE